MDAPASASRDCLSRSSASSSVASSAQPNGIVLPLPWPPTNHTSFHTLTANPPAPYVAPRLHTRARTIRIDVGRQLFVDDFLIERTTLRRRWHSATVESLGVLVPDREWEKGGSERVTARPFGGGSLFDPRDQLVKLWYRCGWRGTSGKTCIAVSRDGLRFVKPAVRRGRKGGSSNVVLESRFVEAFEVVYDHVSTPPRFVALRMEWMTHGSRVGQYSTLESPDGMRWRRRNKTAGVMADRSTFFLNPLRRRPHWVFSLRENLCAAGPSGHMRSRRYWERPHDCFLSPGPPCNEYRPFVRQYFQCHEWSPGEPVPWFGVDRLDCGYGECDVYNVDGIAYESLLLHGLAVLHGPHAGGELKNNSVHLAFSRDGFHLSRPPPPAGRATRAPFISLPPYLRAPRGRSLAVSNLQLAQGSPLVASDRLLFYFGYGAQEREEARHRGSVYGK